MLYAITDRRLVSGNEADARARQIEVAAIWAANGVAFIQIREKDLSARDQVELTRAVVRSVRSLGKAAHALRVLVNGRVDVALAAGADGVHLSAGPDALTPEEVRRIFDAAGRSPRPVISVSCHTIEEVNVACQQFPDCMLFAPVFEKVTRKKSVVGEVEKAGDSRRLPGSGLALLEQACRMAAPVPVFALGGVTPENVADCVRAGAAGIAAIRMMQGPPSAWKYLA